MNKEKKKIKKIVKGLIKKIKEQEPYNFIVPWDYGFVPQKSKLKE